MARGRPKKQEQSLAELIDKANRHEPMTLDEAAKVMGSTYYVTKDPTTGETRILEPKKYSVMGLQKLEQRALAKLKAALAEKGIKSLDDIFEPKYQMPAKSSNTREYS